MNIVTAPRRDSRHWTQDTITWDELVLWMLDPGTEKESGSYILGTLTETTRDHDGHDCTALHRNRESVVSRDALTLDSDTPGPDFIQRVNALGVRSLVHTTYNSTPESPRYRVIIPLSRPVSPAEYAAEAQAVMGAVGQDSFDQGSTQAERYMFRPAGEHFSFEVFDGPVREPVSVPAPGMDRPTAKRDPFDLPGVVGAFNRVYRDLDALIERYDLPYQAQGSRWWLVGADAAPGVSEIGDGLWWSNHSTDPAYGHAHTAFDLMRLHKFGQEDAAVTEGTSLVERPSYAAAIALAQADEDVRLEMLETDFGPASPLTLLGYDPDSVRDHDLACQLADRGLSDRYRFTDHRGWFVWDGRRWEPTTATTLIEPVTEGVRELSREWTGRGVAASEINKLNACLDYPRAKRLIDMLRSVLLVESSRFDAHHHLLNVANGTVDMRTGELRPHDRGDYLTKITPVKYVPGATHPDWDTALTVLRPDTREWMQVRMGQAATGHRTPDDLMPVLQGGGANGKTTFTGAVFAALGEHATFLSERVLLSNPGDHPTEMMSLQGARFALLEETPEGQHLNIKRLKSLVGTPTITARRMRQDDETFEATHSLFLTTNYHLNVTETDTGTWRRLCVVQFPYTYSDTLEGEDVRTPDPRLRSRIEENESGQLEAVLAWLVAGARRWFEAGQIMPPIPGEVAADTLEWRSDADPVFSYVRERVTFDPQAAVLSTELYEDFTNWLSSHGRQPWSDKTFSARFQGHSTVSSQGVSKARVRAGQVVLHRLDPLAPAPSGQFRVWKGLRISD